MMNRTTRLRLSKGALAIGALAVSIATLIAHRSPARGYELSIYWATPAAFWLTLLIAVFISVMLSFTAKRRLLRSIALWIGGISTVVFVALPLIRGYYFFGPEDALTHLGIAKSFVSGSADLTTAIYPGIHVLAAVLGTLTGRPLRWSLLLVVPVFVALFVCSIVLCSRALVDRSTIDPTTVFSAMLLLPISVLYLPVLQPIPTSEAILFVPLATFVLLAYARRRRRFAFGALLALALSTLLAFHPQHGLVFGAMLVVVLLTQFIAQTATGEAAGITEIGTLFVQFVLVGVGGVAVVWLWLRTQSLFGRGVSQLTQPLFGVESVEQFRAYLSTHSTNQIVAELLDNPSRPITPRSDTLSQLGISARMLYRRAFSVEILYGVFAFLSLFVPVLSRATNRRGIRYSVVISLVCGLVPASILVVLYVLAGNPLQYFRYLGFALVFVTMLGALSLGEIRATLETWLPPVPVRSIFVIGLVVVLVVSSFTLFRSPYIYQPTDHVSEGQMSGYDHAFTYSGSDVPFAGVDSPVFRYSDGIRGTDAQAIRKAPLENARSSGAYARVAPHFWDQSLRTQVEQPTYLTVTAADRQTSTRLYGGVEFSRADFASLDATPGIAKVQSNGQFTLYLIHPANTTSS